MSWNDVERMRRLYAEPLQDDAWEPPDGHDEGLAAVDGEARSEVIARIRAIPTEDLGRAAFESGSMAGNETWDDTDPGVRESYRGEAHGVRRAILAALEEP